MKTQKGQEVAKKILKDLLHLENISSNETEIIYEALKGKIVVDEEFVAWLQNKIVFCDHHVRKNLENPPNNLAEMYFYAKRNAYREILEVLEQ